MRWLPWVAALVLAAGVIAFMVAYFGNTANNKETFEPGKVAVSSVHRNVPLSKDARVTAGKFILTAVKRSDAVAAYNLSGPSIRGGETLKEWVRDWKDPNTGIPVVPYTDEILAAKMKIDYSWADEAELQVIIVPKQKGKQGTRFVMLLKKVGTGDKAHWVVDYWQPYTTPKIPAPG